MLLIGALTSGGVSGTASHGQCSSSTLQSVQQQLQQSGLLQQLPTLLTAAAECLQTQSSAAIPAGQQQTAHTAAAAAAAADARYNRADVWGAYVLTIFGEAVKLVKEFLSAPEGVACISLAMHCVVAAHQYSSSSSSMRAVGNALLQAHDPESLSLIQCAIRASFVCMLTITSAVTSSLDNSSSSSPTINSSGATGGSSSTSSHTNAAEYLAKQLQSNVHFTQGICLTIAVWLTAHAFLHNEGQPPKQQ
jgi:hypothetical protein